MIFNNLPPQPYKRFFGRQKSIEKIFETLIEGGTFIASIDGVGGIGKTALAYFFCTEILIKEKLFNYIIWLTAKETVFDPFSKMNTIKKVRTDFRGIEELVDSTLSVINYEEHIQLPLEEKKHFVEDEIFKKEKIFIVLDNLETIEDNDFFDYITRDFNKISRDNRHFKVLTTSRKRKKIADFPIEIEGLEATDALNMLKFLAKEHRLKEIINASDHDNIKLLERVGFIPLGIEFIIGQMTLGKSRGDIFSELQGYPNINDINDEVEKRKRLSDIILFSFKNMYETLTEEQQYVFKIIASLARNKLSNDPPISFELLLSITDLTSRDVETSIEVLLENNLIVDLGNNEYNISQMAINFVRQFYEDFGNIEDEVIERKTKILHTEKNIRDRVDLFLNKIQGLVKENKFEDAEKQLIDSLERISDARIYFELAKIQRTLNKFIKADDNFRMAAELDPSNVKIWFEWINMEDNRQRYNVALQLAKQALEKTNNDVTIALQLVNIYKFRKQFDIMRQKLNEFYVYYENSSRKEELLRLLRNWKNIELNIIKERLNVPYEYFEIIKRLIEKEFDLEIKLQLSHEALNLAKKLNNSLNYKYFSKLIENLEKATIKDIPFRVKELNRIFNSRNYEEAKKEARKILYWYTEVGGYIDHFKNALRILLQIYSSEKDYDRIILTFNDYKELGSDDQNCQSIYNKAIKDKRKIELDSLISKILLNIQECEFELRKIILFVLDNDEKKLIELVIEKNKSEWIEQWKATRYKALKKDELLIHYSDLSHLRSLLSWTKKDLLSRIIDSKIKYDAENHIKHIVAYLENYISPERQESFHSRLLLFEKDELNHFITDVSRLKERIIKLKELINLE